MCVAGPIKGQCLINVSIDIACDLLNFICLWFYFSTPVLSWSTDFNQTQYFVSWVFLIKFHIVLRKGSDFTRALNPNFNHHYLSFGTDYLALEHNEKGLKERLTEMSIHLQNLFSSFYRKEQTEWRTYFDHNGYSKLILFVGLNKL